MPSGGRGFSVPQNFQTVPGARPASHTVVTGASFPGVKRPGQEVYRPLTSLSAEVRNDWRCTGTTTIYLYDMEGVGGLTFTFALRHPTSGFLSEGQKVQRMNPTLCILILSVRRYACCAQLSVLKQPDPNILLSLITTISCTRSCISLGVYDGSMLGA